MLMNPDFRQLAGGATCPSNRAARERGDQLNFDPNVGPNRAFGEIYGEKVEDDSRALTIGSRRGDYFPSLKFEIGRSEPDCQSAWKPPVATKAMQMPTALVTFTIGSAASVNMIGVRGSWNLRRSDHEWTILIDDRPAPRLSIGGEDLGETSLHVLSHELRSNPSSRESPPRDLSDQSSRNWYRSAIFQRQQSP
jgi:hypothetical protein